MSKFEEKVIQKIGMRAAKGLSKYGVSMERKDLSFMEWLTHLQEELMDATVYVERLMEECECPIHGNIASSNCPYCSRL
jgi:hypothetical protein